MGSSSPTMEHPPLLKLIPKSRFRCGLHLLILISVHLILYPITYKIIYRENEERKLEEKKGRKLEHSARVPCLGVQSSNPGVAHPHLGVDTNA
ncbi:hypothetical protein PIB30_088490 [Stylosanthes scabra]|uniref:Transmembrane protein n=1 Tax=Stylosanthes scabra TaxID=79078 RepID=A0ABU6YSP3_9FABA|nr:hypothetical protein [Stylosanthes scabra]